MFIRQWFLYFTENQRYPSPTRIEDVLAREELTQLPRPLPRDCYSFNKACKRFRYVGGQDLDSHLAGAFDEWNNAQIGIQSIMKDVIHIDGNVIAVAEDSQAEISALKTVLLDNKDSLVELKQSLQDEIK